MSAHTVSVVRYERPQASVRTYCSGVNGIMLSAIRQAWRGRPWDGVEVLTGKTMQPSPGMRKTMLVGQCIYRAHKYHPAIREMIAAKGGPPPSRGIF